MATRVFRSNVGDTKPVDEILEKETAAGSGLWTPIDLTGATVRFHLVDGAGALLLDAAAAVLTPAAGSVRYAWGAGGNANVGSFGRRWTITYPSGTVETVPDQGAYPVLFQ
jgi:hypothetical protein